jgi:hypothetical protein
MLQENTTATIIDAIATALEAQSMNCIEYGSEERAVGVNKQGE